MEFHENLVLLLINLSHRGLITYRETALLYQANASTLSAKSRVAEVIAHELAHQCKVVTQQPH